MSVENGGWNEWKNLIFSEIKRLNSELDAHENKLEQIKTKLQTIETEMDGMSKRKALVYGVVCSITATVVAGCLVFLITTLWR